MKIESENYNIWYDGVTKTVTFQGKLRLAGMEEYAPIVQLLDDVIGEVEAGFRLSGGTPILGSPQVEEVPFGSTFDQQPPRLTLDLEELEFLNSSGINVFLKFVLKVRQQQKIQLVVRGSTSIPWQGKSLKNFQRLMPELQLELN